MGMLGKKLLAVFMSVVLVMGLCPGLAIADEGKISVGQSKEIQVESEVDNTIVENGSSTLSTQAFSPHLNAPAKGSYWYYTNANIYYKYGLAGQCTWYAYGRASEILGYAYPQRKNGNGGEFWSSNYKFTTGQTPKVGAIACSGPYVYGVRYGHVAVVEQVNSNGSFTVSEYWGNKKVFHTGTYANGAAWARANSNAGFQGFIYLVNGPSTAKTPTIVPHDVLGGKKIELKNNESGASIRYTKDGKTNPSNSVGDVYNGNWIDDDWPIMGVRAIAYKSGMNNSSVAGLTNYTNQTQAPSIIQNNTSAGATIEIASPTRGATIIYTTDGSNPGFNISKGITAGKKYTGAFSVTKNCTVKAIAVASGMRVSGASSKDVACVVPGVPEIKLSADKIAQGDAVEATWARDASAASYTATLYKGSTSIESKNVTTPEVTFALSDAGSYSIGVRATNVVGASDEGKSASVESVAPLSVKFMSKYTDDDGKQISRVDNEQKVKYGYGATRPESSPKRRGYTFSGWDRSFDKITADTEVMAVWEVNEYIVQFYSSDGTARLSRQAVKYGQAATEPNPGAAPTGKVFSGWAVTNADDDSARNFKKVDSDLTLRAVFAWADEELPVVAQITNAERTASGNYTIDVKLTNYPKAVTTALLRVALKTKSGKLVQTSRETIEIGADQTIDKKVTMKYSGNYVASTAEVEVVGIDGNYRTGGAYSAAVTKDIVTMDNFYYTDWSAWSTSKPTASDTVEVEQATQYRYRDKQATTSTSTTLNGWTRDGKSTTSYGAWSGNKSTTSKPSENDTLRITGSSTKYSYYRYCNYYDRQWQQDSKAYGSSSQYHEITLNSPMAACANKFADKGGKAWDLHGPYSSCSHKREGQSYWWTKGTTTTYTYQTRSKTVTYGYYKWGDWSTWSFDGVTADANREVEKRTVYRSRTKMPGQIKGDEDAAGTKQSVSGKLDVSANLAGKEATIMVYNATNTDPNEDQIQYIGQTKIGAGNSYSFDFIPRQDPSAESGDFIVALGVKGATGLVNVATIKAPRAKYKVTFQYEKPDGSIGVVSEQEVLAGDDAKVPAAPEREGSLFLGWSSSASRVNSDMVVNALFSPRTCTVAWADYGNESVVLQSVEYGSELVAPVVQAGVEGYTFKGWDAILNGTAKVTKDMVVTAVYEPVKHTVTFADGAGNAFKTEEVEHGKAADLPEGNPTAEGKVFAGWDTTSGTTWWNVTEDMTVKPVFMYEETASAPYTATEVAEGYVSPNGAKVYLESPTEGATIYYTTDGSEPTSESSVYSADDGITITQPSTVKAYSSMSAMNDSSIAEVAVNVTATNDISKAEAGVAEAPFFYGSAVEPGIMVWFGDELLTYGDDYTVKYANNKAIGTATATVTGTGRFVGVQSVTFDIVAAPSDYGSAPVASNDLSSASVSGLSGHTYTGSAIAPRPTVKLNGSTLVQNKDYTVSYKNNVNSGTATATIVGMGSYTGRKTVTFYISMADNPISVKAKSKPINVKFSKLKKKTQKIKRANAFAIKNAKAPIEFFKDSGNSKISISSKGVVTVKKGLKKGKYNVKVIVLADGNNNVFSAMKTVKLQIRVK